MKSKEVLVYSPAARNIGFGASIVRARDDLRRSRHLLWRLFVRDFTAQFRQRLLGVFWAFLTPVLAMVPFLLLNYAGVLDPGNIGIAYPVFVFFGTMLWTSFSAVLASVAGGLAANSTLLLQVNLSRFAISLSGLGAVLYGLAVNSLLLLIMALIYGTSLSWGALAVPILLAPLIALGLGIGLVLSVFNVLARDVTTIVQTILGLLMYVVPVAYLPKFENPIAAALVMYNPLTHLVAEARNVVFFGNVTNPGPYALSVAFAFVVLWLGIRTFYLIESTVAERL
jgi:lipopolysaccharide transport system permease protein